VSVVDDDRRAAGVQHIEAARHFLRTAREGREAAADHVIGQAETPRRGGGGQRVLHLKRHAAVRKRDLGQADQRALLRALRQDEVAHRRRGDAASRSAMLGHGLLGGIQREKADAAGTIRRHRRHTGVGGIQHGEPVRADGTHNDLLHGGELVGGVDAA